MLLRSLLKSIAISLLVQRCNIAIHALPMFHMLRTFDFFAIDIIEARLVQKAVL